MGYDLANHTGNQEMLHVSRRSLCLVSIPGKVKDSSQW